MTTEDTLTPLMPPPQGADSAESAPAPAPVRRRGPLALAAGVLLSPRATFAYLRDRGGRSWLWPVLLALALTVASRAVAIPIEEAQAQAALEAMREQLGDPPRGGDVTFGTVVGGPMIAPASSGPVARSPLADYGWAAAGLLGRWLLAGVALFGLAWLLGGRPGFGGMLRMAAWATLPLSLGLLVGLGVMLGTGRLPKVGLNPNVNGQVMTVDALDETPDDAAEGEFSAGGRAVTVVGPGGAAVGAGPSLLAFLRSNFMRDLSLYTLWFLLVLGIGAAVTARIGPVRASLATLGYWGLSLVLVSLPPLLTFWLFSLTGAGGGLRPLP